MMRDSLAHELQAITNLHPPVSLSLDQFWRLQTVAQSGVVPF